MRKRSKESIKIKFNLSLITGVFLIVSIMSVSTVGMVLSAAHKSALQNSTHLFELSSLTARESTLAFLEPALDFALMTASIPGVDRDIPNNGVEHPVTDLFIRLLETHEHFYSTYIGLNDGSFFQVISTYNISAIIEAHQAPMRTRWIVRTIIGSEESREQTYLFLDRNGEVLDSRTDIDFEYDPRKRPWYQEAMEFSEAILSAPYEFNSLQQPGITASCALPNRRGVAGVDLTLTSLSLFLAQQKISENGGILLLDEDLTPISESPGISNLLSSAELTLTSELFTQKEAQLENSLLHRGEIWQLSDNRAFCFFSAAPLKDFMNAAYELQTRILFISLIIVLFFIPFVILWSRQLSHALKQLTRDAERVGHLDFSGQLEIHTRIYEFFQLSEGFKVMKKTIAQRTDALHKTLEKLELLVEMTIAMSAEYDINKLSEMILSGAKHLTNADGGSLYLVNEAGTQLDFQIVLNDSLHFKQGGIDGAPVTMPPVPLYNSNGKENHHNVVTHAFHSGFTENIPDAYESNEYDFSGTQSFDEANNYRSRSFLTVPLKPRGGGPIMGALQLINSIDPKTEEVVPFPEEWNSFTEALGSAAAVAVQNWRLMQKEKNLFDDLVRFIAMAIDAKSPYTAKHCERVTEISEMIAMTLDAQKEGPFAPFSMQRPEAKREFNIAAWLHDCGKISIPEHILDKATKLETVYNRIHEIRTRFEVLLRDAQIARHQAILDGQDGEQADRDLKKQEKKLQEDFAFVASCNLGCEKMEEANLRRLEEIGRIPWLRHFDNRLGLSWAETARMEIEALSPLSAEGTDIAFQGPAVENLISDKPEHILIREEAAYNRYKGYGFDFNVTDIRENKGELYNLSISKGTLTREERFLVNAHAAQTILMLEQLRFPDDLLQVPLLAGHHHERLDGSGYPRGLQENELSISDQILAVADIFEALISSDRPYKKAKKLSEVVEILYGMSEEGKIGKELFKLLLESGIYLKIAEKYLAPEKIDAVDIDDYMQN